MPFTSGTRSKTFSPSASRHASLADERIRVDLELLEHQRVVRPARAAHLLVAERQSVSSAGRCLAPADLKGRRRHLEDLV